MFKIAVVMMAPDGDPKSHRASLQTGRMEYLMRAVEGGNIDQAVTVCAELTREEKVHAIFLCPGFDYAATARIKAAVGADVSVSVTHSDMDNAKLAVRLLAEQGIVH